jgi:hypothetical protein
MNEPIGRFGSLRPGPGAPDGVGDGGDRLVLADEPLVEALLHVDELLGLALEQAADRDAGPARHDLGDVVGVDLLLEQDRAPPSARAARSAARQLLLELAARPYLSSAARW